MTPLGTTAVYKSLFEGQQGYAVNGLSVRGNYKTAVVYVHTSVAVGFHGFNSSLFFYFYGMRYQTPSRYLGLFASQRKERNSTDFYAGARPGKDHWVKPWDSPCPFDILILQNIMIQDKQLCSTITAGTYAYVRTTTTNIP